MESVNLKKIDERSMTSAYLIKTYDLKNRRKFPHLPTRIIDNFFEAPAAWRAFALAQEFHKSKDGTWPGLRTDFLNAIDDSMFETFAKKLLDNLPGFAGFSSLKASFHLIDDSYGQGWVHDDDPTYSAVGVVYLNKNAPIGSGTTIYSDKYDPDADTYRQYANQDLLFADTDQRTALEEKRKEQRNKFKPNLIIENVFNRCIIYDPRAWHSPNNFFGKTKEDSRLTLVFFGKR